MHPEIEKLIDLAIADGQITDKERNVILKKAADFGVDSDEVEMVLDGKLHQQEASKPKLREKVGYIKTCPACGASVKSFQFKCEDCGHEFIDDNHLEELDKMKIKISNVQHEYNELSFKQKLWITPLKMEKDILDTYSIPKTKDALMSFILFASARTRPTLLQFTTGPGSTMYKNTFSQLLASNPWFVKLEEALRTANLVFKADTEFQNKIQQISQEFKITL
jgi:hypothetical protein